MTTESYEAFRRTKFFNSLDGLRCVSILAVVWQHTGGQFGGPWTNTLLGRGYMGVELFFVISGFLITTLLLREKDAFGQISLRSFYIRRSLRIFPLYYAVLALFTVLVLFTERHSDVGHEFFYNLRYFATYTSNLFVHLKMDREGQMRTIFIFAWSLATEEQFYLVWPSVVRFVPGLLPLTVVGAFICLDQSLRFHLLSAWISPDGQAFHLMTTAISSAICLGVLVAFLLHHQRAFAIAWRVAGSRWASAVAAGLVILALAVPGTDGVAWWRLTSQCAMALLVMTCVAQESHVLTPFLSSRVAVSIGSVSYGMYMLHMFGVHGADKILTRLHLAFPIARFVGSAAIAFGLATLSYRFYESPFLKLKERWSRRSASATRAEESKSASISFMPQLNVGQLGLVTDASVTAS